MANIFGKLFGGKKDCCDVKIEEVSKPKTNGKADGKPAGADNAGGSTCGPEPEITPKGSCCGK